jgi:hypothetical protein
MDTSVTTTPEHHQEVGHEEESGGIDVEDQEDEQDSLKKEVKDFSKLNQVLGVVAKLTKQTSDPGILQETDSVQSTPVIVSGDNTHARNLHRSKSLESDTSSEVGYESILQVPHAVWKSFGVWWSLPEKLLWYIL